MDVLYDIQVQITENIGNLCQRLELEATTAPVVTKQDLVGFNVTGLSIEESWTLRLTSTGNLGQNNACEANIIFTAKDVEQRITQTAVTSIRIQHGLCPVLDTTPMDSQMAPSATMDLTETSEDETNEIQSNSLQGDSVNEIQSNSDESGMSTNEEEVQEGAEDGAAKEKTKEKEEKDIAESTQNVSGEDGTVTTEEESTTSEEPLSTGDTTESSHDSSNAPTNDPTPDPAPEEPSPAPAPEPAPKPEPTETA
jgi:hypothetical protein